MAATRSRIGWVSSLAVVFGAAVMLPSMIALAVTIYAVAVAMF
jgi:hypothetical protein